METPFSGAGFNPDQAYAAAAERFFDLLKTFSAPQDGAAAQARDWSSMAGPLATQFEQWLRLSQSTGPWFGGPAAGAAGMPPGFMGTQAWSFGPLPLGPAAVQQPEAQRIWELLGRLTQLQGELATHWSEVARSAAQRFVTRVGVPQASASPEDSLKLYEQWVNCAEEAYAVRARRDDFCRLQGELANVSASLLVEQRRHAEGLVRAFGLPTRKEVDALHAQIRELSRQLEELAEAAPPRKRSARRPARAPAKPRAARAPPKRARRGRRS